MSFLGYRGYRPSGAAHLGQVPAHWDVRPLKYLATLSSGGTPSKDRRDFWDGDIPWASAKDLKSELLRDTADHITDAAVDEGGAQIAPAGAILVLVRGMMLARAFPVCIAGQPMAINQDLKSLMSQGGMRNDYLAWLLRGTARETLDRLDEAGHGTKALRMEAWTSMKLPVPPEPEQQAIAVFLHRETAKIDALVEEQRRLIELLKEKRQAVISHAVTKGLDPSAPMKDSGVEWLGEVPAHWNVTALKRLCSKITDGAHISPDTEGGIYCFVSTKDVTGVGIDFEGCLRTSPASFEYLIRTGCRPEVGDVLFSKDGTIGRTVVVRDSPEFVVASSLIIIRPAQQQLDPNFLHFLCQSVAVQSQVESFVKGAGLPRLSIQNLLRVIGVFPPLDEQAAIAEHLSAEAARSGALIDEAERAVLLLQERRAALISAAVTGTIDVRGRADASAELELA